jgi:MFS transporter, MHS family, alpha-ketoglutarate permease
LKKAGDKLELGIRIRIPKAKFCTKSVLVAFLLIAAAWLIVAGYTSINAVVKAELFPTKVRATGVGVPYAVTVSIFGGTAESIAL